MLSDGVDTSSKAALRSVTSQLRADRIPAEEAIWRALADSWASRRLLLATRPGPQDPAVEELARFLVQPSQKAKARARNEQ